MGQRNFRGVNLLNDDWRAVSWQVSGHTRDRRECKNALLSQVIGTNVKMLSRMHWDVQLTNYW